MTTTLLALAAFKVFSLRKEKPFKSDPTMWGWYSAPDLSKSTAKVSMPLKSRDSEQQENIREEKVLSIR
ncbi:MAG: hypothetical protein IAF58_19520 [Leptolyngbya sp.]|nr:hypothetical protein [Candidatus Melainabacteria bacterium]